MFTQDKIQRKNKVNLCPKKEGEGSVKIFGQFSNGFMVKRNFREGMKGGKEPPRWLKDN